MKQSTGCPAKLEKIDSFANFYARAGGLIALTQRLTIKKLIAIKNIDRD